MTIIRERRLRPATERCQAVLNCVEGKCAVGDLGRVRTARAERARVSGGHSSGFHRARGGADAGRPLLAGRRPRSTRSDQPHEQLIANSSPTTPSSSHAHLHQVCTRLGLHRLSTRRHDRARHHETIFSRPRSSNRDTHRPFADSGPRRPSIRDRRARRPGHTESAHAHPAARTSSRSTTMSRQRVVRHLRGLEAVASRGRHRRDRRPRVHAPSASSATTGDRPRSAHQPDVMSSPCASPRPRPARSWGARIVPTSTHRRLRGPRCQRSLVLNQPALPLLAPGRAGGAGPRTCATCGSRRDNYPDAAQRSACATGGCAVHLPVREC